MRAVVVWLILGLSIPCFAQVEVIQVRVSAANIREEPTTESTIVAVLHEGDIREIVGDVPFWFEILLTDGRSGFIAKRLTTVIVDTSGVEDFEDELGEPMGELYAIPPHAPTVTLPSCTPSTLTVDFTVCPVEGSGGANALANVVKNRVALPCTFEAVTVDNVLHLNSLPRNVRSLDHNDPRLQYLEDLEARPVRLDGFLAMVKRSDKESTNCQSASRRDLHVDIARNDTEDPKDHRMEAMVTEVTPWFSEQVAAWTATNLGQHATYRGGYSGANHGPPTQVRIYGWLFFDNWHGGDGTVGTTRGTAWEVHPITRIEVLINGTWTVIQ